MLRYRLTCLCAFSFFLFLWGCNDEAGSVASLDAGDVIDASGDVITGCLPACEGRECGADGCGGVCGRCTADSVCDRTQGLCEGGGCVPMTCEALGAACGAVDDGCEQTLMCGDCPLPDTCGGAGVANACGCTPDCSGRDCGDDGCGGVCGACGSLDVCDAGECVLDCDDAPDGLYDIEIPEVTISGNITNNGNPAPTTSGGALYFQDVVTGDRIFLATSWCTASTPYATDLGTPNGANDACP